MKTSIIDELELPEETQAAARREALRTERPVNEVIAKWVVEKAAAITKGTKGAHKGKATTAA